MRTNIMLDEEVVAKAFKYSHARTKKALIDEALKELIASRQRLDLREIKGKIEFKADYDYKKLRKGN